MSQTFCHLRGTECMCTDDQCVASPVIRIDLRSSDRDPPMTSTINNGCEVFKRGCVVAFVFGMMTAGLMSAENFYKKDDLRKQEITHVARR